MPRQRAHERRDRVGPRQPAERGAAPDDTPTMRGNFNLMQLSSHRSIRSMDHFATVEEYFDGDPGLMQRSARGHSSRSPIAWATSTRSSTFAGAEARPDGDARPQPGKSTGTAGRGALPRQGQCTNATAGPRSSTITCTTFKSSGFTPAGRRADQDLPAAWHQDSPPYLHDGRCPTLHDAVEFFNLVLELKLSTRKGRFGGIFTLPLENRDVAL